jgi:Pyruvate/2-oxoacid:ferredoxin oxidoreductase gamma subunit
MRKPTRSNVPTTNKRNNKLKQVETMKVKINQREKDIIGFAGFGVLFALSVMLNNTTTTVAYGILATMFLIEARYESIKELIKNNKRRTK